MVVSGDALFAGVMVCSYPVLMRRVASLTELRALLSPGAPRQPAAPPPSSMALTRPGAGLDPASLLPLPQQFLPITSDPSVPLNPAEQRLFLLLCDDLPDGVVEESLALLEVCLLPPPRRLLTVLPDLCERQRLQATVLYGLCILSDCGKGRNNTAVRRQ
ncbi:MAG: hypothetical protein ACK52U_10105 [Synechococcaceae cyanobacterium]